MGASGNLGKKGEENKGPQTQQSQTEWTGSPPFNVSKSTVWVSGGKPVSCFCFFFPSYSLKLPWSVPRLTWALLGLVSVSMGLTKDKAFCSLLKVSGVMYYISNPHQVCLWSHEWIKANPFAFSETQLKAHVFLMVPLSFLCDQQTSLIEHSFRTLLGDRKMRQLLKEVKIPSKWSRSSHGKI